MDAKERWQEAGLYDPLDPDAAERLALLEYLTERGATIEQMVVAHAMGTLPGVAGDLVTQGRTEMVSVADIAERSGFPVQRVMRALLAAGIPARRDTEVPGDLASFMTAFESGSAILGEEAILAFTRSWGPPPTTSPKRPSHSSSRSSDRARSARVPTSSPGPAWPRPPQPPSRRYPVPWHSW